jgi:CCR4-NOT transcriptional regulation complex NOT5 subunit
MTKLLNLNQLSPKEVREVQIGDKTYSLKEMSVEDFIETTKVAEAMESETSYAKQLTATITLVKRSIPEIDETILLNLSLEQLQALTAFIRGASPEELIKPKEEVEQGNA